MVKRLDFDNAIYENKKQKTDANLAKRVLPAILDKITEISNFTNDVIFAELSSLAETFEIKARSLFYVMRIALTGLEVTPGGATEVADLLGKEETIQRLKLAISKL